jgi:hypothetical protein
LSQRQPSSDSDGYVYLKIPDEFDLEQTLQFVKDQLLANRVNFTQQPSPYAVAAHALENLPSDGKSSDKTIESSRQASVANERRDRREVTPGDGSEQQSPKPQKLITPHRRAGNLAEIGINELTEPLPSIATSIAADTRPGGGGRGEGEDLVAKSWIEQLVELRDQATKEIDEALAAIGGGDAVEDNVLNLRCQPVCDASGYGEPLETRTATGNTATMCDRNVQADCLTVGNVTCADKDCHILEWMRDDNSCWQPSSGDIIFTSGENPPTFCNSGVQRCFPRGRCSVADRRLTPQPISGEVYHELCQRVTPASESRCFASYFANESFEAAEIITANQRSRRHGDRHLKCDNGGGNSNNRSASPLNDLWMRCEKVAAAATIEKHDETIERQNASGRTSRMTSVQPDQSGRTSTFSGPGRRMMTSTDNGKQRGDVNDGNKPRLHLGRGDTSSRFTSSRFDDESRRERDALPEDAWQVKRSRQNNTVVNQSQQTDDNEPIDDSDNGVDENEVDEMKQELEARTQETDTAVPKSPTSIGSTPPKNTLRRRLAKMTKQSTSNVDRQRRVSPMALRPFDKSTAHDANSRHRRRRHEWNTPQHRRRLNTTTSSLVSSSPYTSSATFSGAIAQCKTRSERRGSAAKPQTTRRGYARSESDVTEDRVGRNDCRRHARGRSDAVGRSVGRSRRRGRPHLIQRSRRRDHSSADDAIDERIISRRIQSAAASTAAGATSTETTSHLSDDAADAVGKLGDRRRRSPSNVCHDDDEKPSGGRKTLEKFPVERATSSDRAHADVRAGGGRVGSPDMAIISLIQQMPPMADSAATRGSLRPPTDRFSAAGKSSSARIYKPTKVRPSPLLVPGNLMGSRNSIVIDSRSAPSSGTNWIHQVLGVASDEKRDRFSSGLGAAAVSSPLGISAAKREVIDACELDNIEACMTMTFTS